MLAFVVPMWAATAYASVWSAHRIGGRGASYFIGVLLLAGVLFNVAKLPYPIWFKATSVAAIVGALSWRFDIAPRLARMEDHNS